MATNKTELFSNVNGSKWNTGVVFERTNPAPIEKYSVFQTLADAQTYASTNAVAYPGQIITVIGGDQEYSSWTFSDAGTHTVTFDSTWKIDGIDTENSNSCALSITAASITATRTITKPYTIAVYKIIDTSGTLKQIDAEISPTDLPIATATTLGAIKVGEGLGIATDGTLSAQKLTVDQKVEGNETSENPASTKAVYDWSLSTLDTAATTAQNKVDTLETSLTGSYLPTNYLSVGVANTPSATDKLMKRTEVEAKINALDAAISTLTTAETIKSISETDGIIAIEKQSIAIDKSAVNGLTDDLAGINTKITGLQTVSADHATRLTTAESDIDTLQADVAGLKTISASTDTKINNLSTSLSNTVDDISSSLFDKIVADSKAAKEAGELSAQTVRDWVASNYALSTDVTSISSNLYGIIVEKANAAQAAGELSAQAVRDTFDLCAVTFENVKGGKAVVTATNKLVTQDDIAALTGVMHFVGTTTDTNLVDGYTGKPTGISKYDTNDPEQGDFVLRTDTAKEFVYVGEWNTGKWNEIGDEDLYAKKADLNALSDKYEAHAADSTIHITSTERSTWNAKATSAEVSSIADIYRGIEETRATGVESGLRTDVDAISTQVKDFSNTWKAAVDLSVSNLSTYVNGLSTDLGTEVAARKANDTYLSNQITSLVKDLSDYALSADVTTISGNLFDKIVAEETTRKAADTALETKIDNKIKIGSYKDSTYTTVSSDLSVVKIGSDDYHQLVAEEKALSNVIYVVSSDNLNAYDEKIINVAAGTVSSDAVNYGQLSASEAALNAKITSILTSYLSAIKINDVEFDYTRASALATLSIDIISCGSAS